LPLCPVGSRKPARIPSGATSATNRSDGPYSLVQGDIDVIIDLDCAAGSYALPETCDGTDEDCDGTADEDFTGLDEPCTANVGIV